LKGRSTGWVRRARTFVRDADMLASILAFTLGLRSMTIAEISAPPATAETHLSQAIADCALQPLPYPHAFVRDVFPRSYYELLRRNFPDPALLVANDQAGRGNNLPARFVFVLKPNYLNTLPDGQKKFWSEFARWFLGEHFRQCILNKFEESVARRFHRFEHVEFWSDAVLVEDQTTHSMGPHTDHPRKVASLLFYLPADEAQAHLGTTLYRPKDSTFVCSGMAHHARADFDCLATFPFVPNSLLMFAKTDNSFHGIELVEDLNCRRRLLMFNVNVRDR
jgi:hypothetical protein